MATPTSPAEPGEVAMGRASTWYAGSGLGEEGIVEVTTRGDWNWGGGKEELEEPRAWSSMGEEEKGIRISFSSIKLSATWPRSWALPSPKAFWTSVVNHCGCWIDRMVALSPTGTSTSGASILTRKLSLVSPRPVFSEKSCTSPTKPDL